MSDRQQKYLSKSDFIVGRSCPKRLWLNKWQPDAGEKASPAVAERMETGRRIGDLARALYPGGELAERGEASDHSAALTQELIQRGAACIFEATFVDGKRVARVDVLRRVGEEMWALDEVKSSTAKDPKELLRKGTVHDVEFQSQVLEACGLNVVEKALVLINGKYVYAGGEYELNSLFSRVRIDEECAKIQLGVEVDSNTLLETINTEVCPIVETNTFCDGCSYFDYCHQEQPKNCVTFLPSIRSKKVNELRMAGYPTIDLIPDEYELDDRMRLAREVVVSGKPYISDDLVSQLARLRYPAAFVDFESFMPALPAFVGARPYQQICFQWSAHILDSPTSGHEHREFLFDGPADPREDFCRTLYEAVRDCQSIVFYAVFEKARLKEMADAEIPYASQLLKLFEDRGIDLHAVVKENVYFEAFKGKSSIKIVLPALVPDLSYGGMAIADGSSASSAYQEMISEGCSRERREEIRNDLLAYCKLDTLAMVKVIDKLNTLCVVPVMPEVVRDRKSRPEQLQFAF